MEDCEFLRMICGIDERPDIMMMTPSVEPYVPSQPEFPEIPESDSGITGDWLGQMTPANRQRYRLLTPAIMTIVPLATTGHPVKSGLRFSELLFDIATGRVFVRSQSPYSTDSFLNTKIGTVKGYDAALGDNACYGGYCLSGGKLKVITHDNTWVWETTIRIVTVNWNTLTLDNTATYSIKQVPAAGNTTSFKLPAFTMYKKANDGTVTVDSASTHDRISLDIGQVTTRPGFRVDQEVDAVSYWVQRYRIESMSTTASSDSGYVYSNGGNTATRTYTFPVQARTFNTRVRVGQDGSVQEYPGAETSKTVQLTVTYRIAEFDAGRPIRLSGAPQVTLSVPDADAYPTELSQARIRRPFYNVPEPKPGDPLPSAAPMDELVGYSVVVDDPVYKAHPGIMLSDDAPLVNLGNGKMAIETTTTIPNIRIDEPDPAQSYYAQVTGLYTSSTMDYNTAELHTSTVPDSNNDGEWGWGLAIPWGVPRVYTDAPGTTVDGGSPAPFLSPLNDGDSDILIKRPAEVTGMKLRRMLTVAIEPSTGPWQSTDSAYYYPGEFDMDVYQYTGYRSVGLTTQFATLDLDP